MDRDFSIRREFRKWWVRNYYELLDSVLIFYVAMVLLLIGCAIAERDQDFHAPRSYTRPSLQELQIERFPYSHSLPPENKKGVTSPTREQQRLGFPNNDYSYFRLILDCFRGSSAQ